MSSGAPEVTPNIREVWGLVRARTKELRRITVALVPPDAPGVRAYFADGSQRDYRDVGGSLDDVAAGLPPWPPPPGSMPMKAWTWERARVYELNVRPLLRGAYPPSPATQGRP